MNRTDLEKNYKIFESLKTSYETAKESGNEAGMNAAKIAYQKLLDEVHSHDETFVQMTRLYSEMKERGNEYIDFDRPYLEEETIVAMLKEYGFESFTLSSTWSGAVENAWKFQQAGCTLSGMIEINGTSKAFMSDDFEKVHAFLFKIN